MSILSQISDLDKELTKVLQGEGNKLAIDSLSRVFDKVMPTCDELEISARERKACNKLTGEYVLTGLNSEELVRAQSALSEVNAFIFKWNELEEKYSISQEDICGNTKDGIAEFIEALNARTKSRYQGWQDQILDEVRVSEADLELQENSPNLRENAKDYRNLHEEFVQKVESGLLTENTIDNLEVRRLKLIELKDKMDFNQPEDVIKLFQYLRTTGNNRQAPVHMLTKEVLEWMEEHEETGYFYIGDTRIGNNLR